MWKIVFLLFLSTVFCEDVYNFDLNSLKTFKNSIKTNVNRILCPDDETFCDDGYTCCPSQNEKYGCCPESNAVCCSDQKHCCPQGTRCNLKDGSCENRFKGFATIWKSKKPSLAIKNSNACPDGKSQCSNEETCCFSKGGFYECCPFSKAVCCSDQLHCCPIDTVCNLESGTCDGGFRNKMISVWKSKTDTRTRTSIVCPDGKSECDDGQTCCQLQDGSYGCCPDPNAVCCSDHLHCCPHGTKCNLSQGTCDNSRSKVISPLKLKVRSVKITSITCPDGQSQCYDNQTCCLLNDGSYGCCPFLNAVCCSDHLHCCPTGTVCNLKAETCDSPSTRKSLFPMKLKFSFSTLKSVVCPDGKSECDDGQTCCQLPDGSYGCCPDPNAVCCSDHLHCCPQGTKCNLSEGTCDNSHSKVISLLKLKVRSVKVTDVFCPDGKSKCDDGETCCQLPDGTYGCCPYPNAVCCSDHLHCCPEDTRCNLSEGTCDKRDSKVASLLKLKVRSVKVTDVFCPDGKSKCDDGETCCQLPDGTYGCCPYPNAVCCSDHLHCCPEDTRCNLSEGTCDKRHSKVASLLKLKVRSVKVTDVFCPDGKSKCDDGETCCQLPDGTYGCCPYPNAVCCSDHLHCCPEDTRCNLSEGTCDKRDSKVASLLKLKVRSVKVTDVFCPDGKSKCDDGETCCQLPDGTYGCCPYPNAVCCSDHLHCCPEDTRCNLSEGTCDKRHSKVASLLKLKVRSVKVTDVFCPDGKSKCDDGETCCLVQDGSYGCCPEPNAVCCNDHIHCCPENTICNSSAGVCIPK